MGSVITFNKVKNNNTVAEKAAIEEYGYDIYSYDFDSDYYEAGLSCVYKVVEKTEKINSNTDMLMRTRTL